jgi:hypothetical protein
MKNPTQKSFYEHMSKKLNTKYKDKDGYLMLLDIIDTASSDNDIFMDLAELTLMNKRERLVYRTKLACTGKEFTPSQLDQYLTIVEYALEHIY